MKEVPGPTVKRLVLYYLYLEQLVGKDPYLVISSTELGKGVGVTAAQVRKDLSYLGQLGNKGIGYEVSTLRKQLAISIGFNKNWPAVLVGAGNLGRALVYYKKFNELGLEITAIFDCDLNKIGNAVKGIKVRSCKELEKIIRKKGIQIGIIAVPAVEAPGIAHRLVKAGVKAIWNFAPVSLNLPEDIIVISEDLSSGIGSLFFHLKNQRGLSNYP